MVNINKSVLAQMRRILYKLPCWITLLLSAEKLVSWLERIIYRVLYQCHETEHQRVDSEPGGENSTCSTQDCHACNVLPHHSVASCFRRRQVTLLRSQLGCYFHGESLLWVLRSDSPLTVSAHSVFFFCNMYHGYGFTFGHPLKL